MPEPPTLAELLESPGARLSGLRLLDGAVVVKLEQGEAAVHMRVADGGAFDPAGGVMVQTSAVLDLPVRLRRAGGCVADRRGREQKDGAVSASRTRSFSRPLTGGSVATACAA